MRHVTTSLVARAHPESGTVRTVRSPLVHRPLGALLASVIFVSSSAALAQSDDEKAAARALAGQAQDALKANKYAEALDYATRAEALFHAPPHLLMKARAEVGLGHYVAAKETYLKIMREELPANAPNAFKKAQEDAKAEEPAIEPKIGALKIVVDNVKDRKITVKLDDQPVPQALIGVHRPIDPGKHEVIVFSTGLQPVKGSIAVKEGEKQELALALPDAALPGVPVNPQDNPDANKPPVAPPPPDTSPKPSSGGSSTTRKVIGFGAIGLGVVGGVLGGVFLAKRGSDGKSGDDLFAQCKPHCTADQKSAITSADSSSASDGTIATIGLIGGGVALATGVIVLLTGGSSSSDAKPAARVEPWIGPHTVGVHGAF